MALCSIYKNLEYMSARRPLPFAAVKRGGEADVTVLLWYAYTPKGRVSTQWHVYMTKTRHQNQDELLAAALRHVDEKGGLPKLKKGYRWSEPYLL